MNMLREGVFTAVYLGLYAQLRSAFVAEQQGGACRSISRPGRARRRALSHGLRRIRSTPSSPCSKHSLR